MSFHNTNTTSRNIKGNRNTLAAALAANAVLRQTVRRLEDSIDILVRKNDELETQVKQLQVERSGARREKNS